MEGFDVTSVELRYCGDQLSQLAGDVRDELRSLGSDVDALLRTWQGRAADGFGEGWRTWQRGAHDVVEGLAADSEALAAAGRAYADTEQGAMEGFRP